MGRLIPLPWRKKEKDEKCKFVDEETGMIWMEALVYERTGELVLDTTIYDDEKEEEVEEDKIDDIEKIEDMDRRNEKKIKCYGKMIMGDDEEKKELILISKNQNGEYLRRDWKESLYWLQKDVNSELFFPKSFY